MFYRHLLAIGFLLAAASPSHAFLNFRFRQLATNQTTNPIVYPNPFDTWVFEVYNSNPANGDIDRLSLVFGSGSGTFLQTAGNIAFRNQSQGGATVPVVFGFDAPDTFFLLPGSANPVAFGVTDTTHTLSADYTTDDHSILVPVSVITYTPVAFFSVPSGQSFNDLQFLAGAGWHGTDPPQRFGGFFQLPFPWEITPEPASLSLLIIFLLSVANVRRCSI